MKIYNEDRTKHIDSTLYKYAGINSNLFSALINNELWFSSPSDFNDPYDCNLNYDFSNVSEDQIYNYFNSSQLKLNRTVTDEEIRTRAKFLFDNPNECVEIGKTIIQTAITPRGITCFSEQDDILLMWSHYANSHKGVCLTFDIERDKDFFNRIYQVEYPEAYPIFNPFTSDTAESLQLLLATKSKEWAYEKEVRIIKTSDFHLLSRGLISFQSTALTEIKFGYKASDEDIKTVRNLVATKYPHVKLYRSKIKNGEFGIEFIPI